MSAQTKTYVAHSEQVGRVQYVALLIEWAHDDRNVIAERTFPNFGLAKAWATKEVAKRQATQATDIDVWPEIVRGSWQTDEFHDPGYGTVHDAVFESDDEWECTGWFDPATGAVDWSVADYGRGDR